MKAEHVYAKLIEPLSFDQIAAIFLYTTDYLYRDVRNDISNNKGSFADFICQLIVGINKLPMVWKTSYRGFSERFLKFDPNFFDSYKNGTVIRWDAMNSSSLDRNIANQFASSGYAVEMQGYHGRDISAFSRFPNEAEIIYIISSHFLITGKYKKDDITWFTAKEMSFPWNDKAILWIDDKPKNNKLLMEALEREGIMVIPRHSTKQAMQFCNFMNNIFLNNKKFIKYKIVSDMKRNEKKNEDDEKSEIITDSKAGAVLLQKLRQKGYNNKVCIYTGHAKPAMGACAELGYKDNILVTVKAAECFNFCTAVFHVELGQINLINAEDKMYIEYTFTFKLDIGDKTHQFKSRYSLLRQLHQVLIKDELFRKAFKGNIPSFPSKHILTNYSKKTNYQQRANELLQYFKCIISNPLALKNELFQDGIQLNDELKQLIASIFEDKIQRKTTEVQDLDDDDEKYIDQKSYIEYTFIFTVDPGGRHEFNAQYLSLQQLHESLIKDELFRKAFNDNIPLFPSKNNRKNYNVKRNYEQLGNELLQYFKCIISNPLALQNVLFQNGIKLNDELKQLISSK